MLFLNSSSGKQAELLRTLKEKTVLTWKQVSKLLKVNRSMIFLYLNGKCKIPKFRLEILCKTAGIELNSLGIEFVEESPSGEKQMKIPKMDERLAEFLGILSGDGCLESNNYSVSITCGKELDSEYVSKKVAPLIEAIFSLKPTVFSNAGRINCRIYSKQLWTYLTREFSFPVGEKKDRLKNS